VAKILPWPHVVFLPQEAIERDAMDYLTLPYGSKELLDFIEEDMTSGTLVETDALLDEYEREMEADFWMLWKNGTGNLNKRDTQGTSDKVATHAHQAKLLWTGPRAYRHTETTEDAA
jgi:hypothetical protein